MIFVLKKPTKDGDGFIALQTRYELAAVFHANGSSLDEAFAKADLFLARISQEEDARGE